MKKKIGILIAMLVLAACCCGFFGCADDAATADLTVPNITLNDDYSVTWQAVTGATEYIVNVNNEDVNRTTGLSFPAFRSAGSYSIKVKASNDVAESNFSESVTYSVYSVSLDAGDGYELSGENIAYGGKDYTFRLAVDDLYSQSVPVVKVNDISVTGEDGAYTVQNVSENLTVTVEGVSKNAFAVTKSAGTGYEINGADTATVGEDYIFTVTLKTGYTQSSPVVKVGEDVLIADGYGNYRVANVQAPFSINVENVSLNSYSVTLPTSVAYTITGDTSIAHGADYSFTLAVTPGYDTSSMSVKVNGDVITGNNGTYVISNVSEDLTITVEGLNIITYDVSLAEGEGYTLSGEDTVERGGNYIFTLTMDEGYSQCDPVVKVNGEVISEGLDGKYTVTDVEEALNITVEGVTIDTFTVSVIEGSGYTISGENSKTVSYNQMAEFTIAPTNANDVLVVSAEGITVVAGENNTYSVSEVKSNITLSVRVYDLSQQLLLASNWSVTDGTITQNDNNLNLSGGQKTISSEYIKKVIEAGYTHIKFTIGTTTQCDDIMLQHSETWNRYYRLFSTNEPAVARIDLTEFIDADSSSYYSVILNNRVAGSTSNGEISISDVMLIQSTETTNWTKSNSNIYCAYEDGFIVLDTHAAGNDAYVLTTTEWWARYANNATAAAQSQATLIVYTEWIQQGGNSRGIIWGGAGEPVSALSIGGTAANNITYSEGNQCYWGLDAEGTIKIKCDLLSNRNTYGGFQVNSYAGENEISIATVNEGKIIFTQTQDWITAGYATITLTFDGASNTIWAGNDVWSGGGMKSIDGSSGWTITINFSDLDNKDLVVQFTGTDDNLSMSWELN